MKPTSEGFFSLIYKNEYNEAIYEKKIDITICKNEKKTVKKLR